jgi:curved DNA-binding protein CbpA
MPRPTFDPYAVLGVAPQATPLQVARAHRRLAKRYHPDLHPGPDAAARMQRINRAWHILSSPARRARHDASAASPTIGMPATWATAGQAASTTWRPASGPRTRRPPRPEPIEPSFGDRPLVVLAVSAMLALLFFVGTYLGSLSP